MSSLHGQFIWYELMTSDAQAATAFYSAVMGWHTQDSGNPNMAYTLLSVGDKQMGGLMALPPEASAQGARPGWMGYIVVDDVDAYVQKVQQAGGHVHHAATDIPNVGRFAVAADPQGAVFVLFKGTSTTPPERPVPGTPGHTGWHELYANDWEKAFDFYAKLFGWTKGTAVDMGPMGTYQLFATGGDAVGGMMNRPPNIPVPCWLYYFNVANINAALERVKAHAGQVLNGPMQVPGGSWIAQCMDPQGAVFAIVEPAPMA